MLLIMVTFAAAKKKYTLLISNTTDNLPINYSF